MPVAAKKLSVKTSPRSSGSHLATRDVYTTVPIEDRVRRLEKRQRVSDTNRSWQNSMARKLTISGCLYVTSALLLILTLTPGWFVCAFVPVIGYWLSGIALWLVRDFWENVGK